MMASIRAFTPVLRQNVRTSVIRRTTPHRLLNTTTDTDRCIRHVDGDDLKVDLTMAKALGGPGDKGKTNPEELFAAGYGACFQSAMNAVAPSVGVTMPSKKEDSIVETTVYLVGSMKELDMGLRVDMKVKVKGLKKDELDKVVAKAKEICPYSRATKGNVYTNIEVEAS